MTLLISSFYSVSERHSLESKLFPKVFDHFSEIRLCYVSRAAKAKERRSCALLDYKFDSRSIFLITSIQKLSIVEILHKGRQLRCDDSLLPAFMASFNGFIQFASVSS